MSDTRTESYERPVMTLEVDFNCGRRLFDAPSLGDVVWLNDGEGLRCKGTITRIYPSAHVEGAWLIHADPDFSTFEDWEDGRWVPRASHSEQDCAR